MLIRDRSGQLRKKEDAVELIHRNKLKFAADNLEIVEGLAPEGSEDLPATNPCFLSEARRKSERDREAVA